MAYGVAHIDGPIERVRRGDRDALIEHVLDNVIISTDLGRRQDESVDGRILDDLVQDFDLARGVIGWGLRAEEQYFGANQIAGDRGADIDRIEEPVTGRMGHDRKSEVTVGGMEI